MRSVVVSLGMLSVIVAACIGVHTGERALTQVHREFWPSGLLRFEWHTDANGRMHGESKRWDEEGRLKDWYEYSHGAVIRMREYSDSGEMTRNSHEGSGYLMVPVSK